MLKLFQKGKSFLCSTKWFAILVAAITVNGCSTDINPPPAPNATATGAVIGAVGGGALGSSTVVGAPVMAWFGALAGATIGHNIDKQKTLLKEIQDNGVQVFLIGDYVKLVLPADKFFTAGAPTFNTYSFHLLDKIALFLSKYPKINVKVAGYTDNQGTPERNLALSKEWAKLVADYLWNHGLDARLVYAEGYGQCNTVASNAAPYGRAANRRVEIILYRIPSRPL